MRSADEIVRTSFSRALSNILKNLDDKKLFTNFELVVSAIVQSYKNGGRLYVAGNGGSAADSQHLVAEFVSKLARPRGPLPAESLTTDTSILTAIGNDYGYDEVFARQIEAKLHQEDIFLAISTSGRSKNIIRALEVCKEGGITSVLLTGEDPGPASELATYCIKVRGKLTSEIQEMHVIIYHSLCESVEEDLLFTP